MDKFFVLFFLLVFPALVGIFRHIFQLLYIWQLKEYRIDRFMSFLRFEKKYAYVGTLLFLIKIALLLTGTLYIVYPNAGYLSFSYVIIFVLYFLHVEWLINELVGKRLVRPSLRSARNLLIISTVVIFILAIYARMLMWFFQFDIQNINIMPPQELTLKNLNEAFNPSNDENAVVIPLLTLVVGIIFTVSLAIDLLVPLWTFMLVLVTSPLSYISRKRKIMSARKILRERGKNLKVVAITGSYGKTTTKELIYEILKDRFNVAKTPQNNNTAVGLAQTIKEYVKAETEVFVVEMGAYKKGEINESTNILSPDIAVVTAISQQHLSLFGSLEKLYEAKFELIDGLKDDGLAIFNGDDEKCLMMSRETSKRKIFFYKTYSTSYDYSKFSISKEPNATIDKNLYITNVEDLGEILLMQIRYSNELYSFKVALKEERFSINIAAAILVALELGMAMDEIVNKISSWDYSVEYLNVYNGINDSKIIDDGKSSNKEGFILALDYLDKKFEGNKWVMTQGIIELGNQRLEIYNELANRLVTIATGLITNDEDLILAVRKVKSDFPVLKVNQINGFFDAYRYYVKKGDNVLIEGSFPQDLITKIKSNDA